MFDERHLWAAAALLGAALCVPEPSSAQDSRVGTTTDVSDTEAAYTASGTLTTTDAANDGLPAPPPPVPEYSPVDATPPAGGANWSFILRHQTAAPHWAVGGARNVSIALRGSHIDGPHPSGPVDTDPNLLPEILSKPAHINFGVVNSKILSKGGRDIHLTNVNNHFDHYGAKALITALAGPGNTLGGAFEIAAYHTDNSNPPAAFKGFAMASSSGVGSQVGFFTSGGGLLAFMIGPIDVLDAHGGQSGSIDPAFSSDRVLSGQLQVSTLSLIGPAPGGGFLFGNGTVSLTDPSGQFELSAPFASYVITDTRPGPVSTSFAFLDEVTVVDVADPSLVPSAFLDVFVEEHLLGQGLSSAELRIRDGLVVSFRTATDLVAATNGFTTSAILPASIVVTGSGPPLGIPMLSGPAVGVLTGLLAGLGAVLIRTAGSARPRRA